MAIIIASELPIFKKLYDTGSAGGSSFSGITDMIFIQANEMLSRAEIINNLDQAIVLERAIKNLVKSGANSHDTLKLYTLLFSFYGDLLDDLILISAFELYSKAVLIRKQYIVHEIQEPEDLKKLQRKQPLHINTYRARLKKERIIIGEKTVPVSLLFKSSYNKIVKHANSTIKAFKDINQSRNKSHLHIGRAWTLDRGKLMAIQNLKTNTEKYA